jgi:cyanophycinase
MIIALAGSGEFLTGMAATDRELLELASGDRVAVLPTAAGLEDPAAWGRMGVEHFSRLGARPVHVPLHRRADAGDPEILAALAASDLFYLSGGKPDHLIESLDGTPAWAVMTARIDEGAVIAGCSAGAMALGGWSVSLGTMPRTWREGLGLLPGWGLMPHYDAIRRPAGIERVLSNAPPLDCLAGIDEDTVLLWDGRAWGVRGSGRVVAISSGQAFRAGTRPDLPEPRARRPTATT